MKILVVVAHPDDEVLGCGGAINKHKRVDGAFPAYYIFSRGREDVIDQRFDTYALAGFIGRVEKQIQIHQPTRIYTHHLGDMNKDHRIVAEAVLVATRGTPVEILGFEIYSTSGSFDFRPDTYTKLESQDIMVKETLMREKYPDELREFPHPRSTIGIKTLARYRGMQVGCEYAEAFVTLRRII